MTVVLPAQIFWRKVVGHYTNGKFIETRRKDNKGPAQEFTSLDSGGEGPF